MKEIVLATNNAGKITEFQDILSPIHCLSQKEMGIESVEETGQTFVENALLKARHMCRQTNKPVLADDSGLVVNALDGAPGIYSARYAGIHATSKDNIEHLLMHMMGKKGDERQAHFYCALVLMRHADDPAPLVATGQVNGLITEQASGAQGFGYDPVFWLPSHGCTMAEIPKEIKNTLSHRAQALKSLTQMLAGLNGQL